MCIHMCIYIYIYTHMCVYMYIHNDIMVHMYHIYIYALLSYDI